MTAWRALACWAAQLFSASAKARLDVTGKCDGEGGLWGVWAEDERAGGAAHV